MEGDQQQQSQGTVMAIQSLGAAEFMMLYDYSLVLKCIACRDALLLDINYGFNYMSIKGDFFRVIQTLSGQAFSLNIQGLYVDIFV